MDIGWIKLHRKLLDWEWYDDQNVFRLFIHCLLRANHKAKNWRGIAIESGEFITSYDRLSTETGLSVRNIRTSLNKLKTTGEVTSRSTSKYTVISITYWNDYQSSDKQTDKPETSDRQATDKRPTTNKNDKNDKNDISSRQNKTPRFAKPTIQDIKSYVEENGYSVDAEKFYYFYDSKNWMVGKNKMKKWESALMTWERGNKAGNPDMTKWKTPPRLKIYNGEDL